MFTLHAIKPFPPTLSDLYLCSQVRNMSYASDNCRYSCFACEQSTINPLPIAHHYKCHENTNRSRFTTLQGPYPYQQIKITFQTRCKYNHETWCYAASKAGSTHEIKTHYLLQAVKNPKLSRPPPFTFRLLQGNEASYKIIQALKVINNINYNK